MLAKESTVNIVWNLIEPIVNELGLILWDVRFVKEGASWYLRVFIDKQEGNVDINDCEKVSRAIDKPLDDADPIDRSYCLEVSSPGIERELTRESHFKSCIGEKVKVHLIRAVDEQRDFNGTLTSYENGDFKVTMENGSEMSFNKKDTAWIKLDDFGG
ncbi:MAG: ribosome maturation factor RimP [Clostridiales bacterium]|nr:ribosome maturation factor RimP [Clostridiales bacterium]